MRYKFRERDVLREIEAAASRHDVSVIRGGDEVIFDTHGIDVPPAQQTDIRDRLWEMGLEFVEKGEDLELTPAMEGM